MLKLLPIDEIIESFFENLLENRQLKKEVAALKQQVTALKKQLRKAEASVRSTGT